VAGAAFGFGTAGALAIGAVAIGQLVVGRVRIGRLEVANLSVARLQSPKLGADESHATPNGIQPEVRAWHAGVDGERKH